MKQHCRKVTSKPVIAKHFLNASDTPQPWIRSINWVTCTLFKMVAGCCSSKRSFQPLLLLWVCIFMQLLVSYHQNH